MAEDGDDFDNAKIRAMKSGKQARIALAIPSRSTHSQFLTLPTWRAWYHVVRLASLIWFKHKPLESLG